MTDGPVRTFTMELLARVPGGDPQVIGTVEIPIHLDWSVTVRNPALKLPAWGGDTITTETGPVDDFNERWKASGPVADEVPEQADIDAREVESWTTSEWRRRRDGVTNEGTATRPVWKDGKTGRLFTPDAAKILMGPRP